MVARFTRRLTYSILVLLGISAITFIAEHLAGDPAVLLSGPDATLRRSRFSGGAWL